MRYSKWVRWQYFTEWQLIISVLHWLNDNLLEAVASVEPYPLAAIFQLMCQKLLQLRGISLNVVNWKSHSADQQYNNDTGKTAGGVGWWCVRCVLPTVKANLNVMKNSSKRIYVECVSVCLPHGVGKWTARQLRHKCEIMLLGIWKRDQSHHHIFV